VGLLSQSHKDLPKKAANGQGVSLEEEIGAPTFMSAWVYFSIAKEFIREGCEWTRSIERSRARLKDWRALERHFLERRHLARPGKAEMFSGEDGSPPGKKSEPRSLDSRQGGNELSGVC